MGNFLDKAGLSYFWGKIKAYVDGKRPRSVSITLPASAWSSNQQTATVSGILADESKQKIEPIPATATAGNQSAYYEAGVMAVAQAENSLTFSCNTTPTIDLEVYVVITEVNAL